jgi:alpha-L-fucosidase
MFPGAAVSVPAAPEHQGEQMTQSYQPTWDSVVKHSTSQWFKDAKFGIYTHWGVYSVLAKGPNVTWYPYNMYRVGTGQWEYHVKTYGGPEKLGWVDFIPMLPPKSSTRTNGPSRSMNLGQDTGIQLWGLPQKMDLTS